MKNILFTLLFISQVVNAQKVVDVGKSTLPNTAGALYAVGGQPFANFKYVKVVDGSPYFREEWMGGRVIMSEGFAYDSIYLRLDLVEHELHFLDKDGKEMISTSEVRAIILSDSTNGKKYQFVHSSYMHVSGKTEKGWYQLLDTGHVNLYKRYAKVINENKAYGTGLVEQTIATTSNYFISINGSFTPVKKFKDIPDLLEAKKEELKSFINLKNLSGKKDDDYVALIHQYNSIADNK